MHIRKIWEIFTHPNDLRITAGGEDSVFTITRGPQGDHKPLTIRPHPHQAFSLGRDASVPEVMRCLRDICSIAKMQRSSTEKVENVLTEKHLVQIEEKLKADGVAETYEIFN